MANANLKSKTDGGLQEVGDKLEVLRSQIDEVTITLESTMGASQLVACHMSSDQGSALTGTAHLVGTVIKGTIKNLDAIADELAKVQKQLVGEIKEASNG